MSEPNFIVRLQLGRVLTVAYCLGWAMMPAGALLGGMLIAWVGKAQVAPVYACIGDLVLLIPVAFAFTALGHAERYLPSTAQAQPAETPRMRASPVLPALPAGHTEEPPPAVLHVWDSAHQHCPRCQVALSVWANFCGACGAPQWPLFNALTDPPRSAHVRLAHLIGSAGEGDSDARN